MMNESEVKKFFSALRMVVDAVLMDVHKVHNPEKCGELGCNLCCSMDHLYDTIRVPAQGLELALCNHFEWEYEAMLPKDHKPMMKAKSAFAGEQGATTAFPMMVTLGPQEEKKSE